MRPVNPADFQNWFLEWAPDSSSATERKPGFIIAFWDIEPLVRYNFVPARRSIQEALWDHSGLIPEWSYWRSLRPIAAYSFYDINNWDNYLSCFDSMEELHSWIDDNVYGGQKKVYAERPNFFQGGSGVYMLKNTVMPTVPQGAVVCTILVGDVRVWHYVPDGDFWRQESFFVGNEIDHPASSIGAWSPSTSPSYMYIWPVSPGTHPHLIFSQNQNYTITCPYTPPFPPGAPWQKWYHKFILYSTEPPIWEMDDYEGPDAYSEGGHCITAESWSCADPVPDEAHAPEHLDKIWPGTYKEGNSTWKQLCTKEELDPEHQGEWLEPEEGGQYSYPGPWDSHCLYVVGEDWDGNVKPYFSQISEDALHTWRRQVDGEVIFDHHARFVPPSTSRGWGASTRYKFGLDKNKTPFGLERPNVMISQDGEYKDSPPSWQISEGYAKLLNDDLAEVSLPHTWGSPRVNGVRDWDCIYPASWYMLYMTMMFSNRTYSDLHNSLFIRVSEYPGERVLDRDPEREEQDWEATMSDWCWPDEAPREHGGAQVAKRERLGLSNFPWIPCFMGISVNDTESIRTPKLCVLEEQENLYTDNSTRQNPVSQPADRTTTYCSEINVLGVVFDAEFFQGTAPPTADSLHHAPDMSDYILGSVWFNPSKVFGRTEVDREQAYLPPLAFNMDFVRQDMRNSRVFYPTRKGYISVDYTSKSKKVLQEISDRYISEGECTLAYIAPSRKAYTSKTGDSNSPRAITVTSSVYSSQTTTDAVLEQLTIESAKTGIENLVVPKTSIESLIALGATDISVDILSETATITRRV